MNGKVHGPFPITAEDYRRIGERLQREAQEALDNGDEEAALKKGDLSAKCLQRSN